MVTLATSALSALVARTHPPMLLCCLIQHVLHQGLVTVKIRSHLMGPAGLVARPRAACLG